MEQALQGRVRFGPFELDPRAGELHENGHKTVLQEQQLKVLLMLLEREGEVATREEIKQRLWPNDTVVEFDHGINNTIKNLRRILDDSADDPRYIATIARRGYRLMVPVEWLGAQIASGEEPSPEPSSSYSVSDSIDSGASPWVSSQAKRSGVEGPAVDDSVALAKAKLQVGWLTGKVVSHYRVLEVIGGGGMGLVYRAEDLKLGRAVALKFLPEEVGDDPKARERFDREAHAVSALNHPNICTIYDFDEYEGHPFIAMELLQGRNLRDELAAGHFRLSQQEGLEIAIQIASGLEAAHEKRIIHRDIKPANIFITDKSVAKILDFGVAKVMQLSDLVEAPDLSSAKGDEDKEGRGFSRGVAASTQDERRDQSRGGTIASQDQISGPNGTAEAVSLQDSSPNGTPLPTPKKTTLTRAGLKLGTAGYMSPEQIRGEPLDARTDIFSFGLILYEMATGERAFTGETEAILHDAIQNHQPKPVREVVPEISLQLDEIIGKCLAKQRQRRFQTATELRELLLDSQNTLVLLSSIPIDAIETPASYRRIWLTLSLVFIFLASVGVVVIYRRAHQTPKLTDKDTIVFADWENRTADPVLDDALRVALRINLQQSPYLNRLSGEKVNRELRLMGRPIVGRSMAEPMTFEVAKQVCLRTNSTAVLGGSISDQGNGYHLALRTVNCQTGAILASSEADAVDRSAIVKTLGVIGLLMRAKLGEPKDSLQQFNAPLEQAASSSLEALQAYEQSFPIWETQKHSEILSLLRRAVELDPDFALGYSRLAGALFNASGLDLGSELASESATRAFNLRERTDQRARYSIEFYYYSSVTGELNKAEQVLRQLLRRYPRPTNDGANTYYNLSFLHRQMGNWEASTFEAEEYRRNNPDSAVSYESLIKGNSALGRLNQAKSASEQAQARGLDSAVLHIPRYNLAFLLNDSAGMQEQVAWAERESNLDLLWSQSDTEAFYGRLRGARKLVERVIALSLRAGDKQRAASFRAQLALREVEIGNTNAALGFAHDALALHKIPGVEILDAVTLARTGRVQEAQKLADEVGHNHPLDDAIQNNWLPSISAASNMESDPQVGIRRLALAHPFELGDVSFGTETFGRLYPVYMRGLCHLQARQPQQAAAEFQKILDHYGVVGNFIIGALAHLQLARAQAMAGDTEAARKSYQDFLTLWKDADPDIPIYRQAKAEYAKL